MTNAKHCFSYHTLLHSLFGLGLGFLLAALVTSLQNIWVGVIVMAVAIILDAMQKGPAQTPPAAPPPSPMQ